jgi:hypothetical protein
MRGTTPRRRHLGCLHATSRPTRVRTAVRGPTSAWAAIGVRPALVGVGRAYLRVVGVEVEVGWRFHFGSYGEAHAVMPWACRATRVERGRSPSITTPYIRNHCRYVQKIIAAHIKGAGRPPSGGVLAGTPSAMIAPRGHRRFTRTAHALHPRSLRSASASAASPRAHHLQAVESGMRDRSATLVVGIAKASHAARLTGAVQDGPRAVHRPIFAAGTTAFPAR